MNLADAIRNATRSQYAGHEQREERPEFGWDGVALDGSHSGEDTRQMENQIENPEPRGQAPEPPPASVTSGNAVRLELFLSGEQMTAMLRAIMAGQHSVLTLREAAAYLRISPSTLERLVEGDEIPGVEIDGRWRFPKLNLDDWLLAQLHRTKEQDDAA
ncbi:MAG: helix-turn-helix domain-containing protein [Armatimonadetes bacterium]|nr:helix-turn-helix domain-containing protein [Armatimonadota bacterium]